MPPAAAKRRIIMAKKEKKKSGFWSDFRKFVMRGNVLDLAVAVVVGGAFNKIVSGLVSYIINPFIGIFMKEGSLDTIKTVITPAVLADDGVTVVTPEVAILWGTWLQTILDFLIIALVIFTIVRVLTKAENTLHARQIAEKAEADKKAAEKAEAEKKAAEEAAAALEAENKRLRESLLNQEKLLADILAAVKK